MYVLILSFGVIYIITFTNVLCFCVGGSKYSLGLHAFILVTLFDTCKPDLLAKHSQFLFIWEYVLPSFLRDNFTGNKTVHWQVFTFSTWHVLPYGLLFSSISDEKSTINSYKGSLVCDELFSYTAFEIVFFFLSFQHVKYGMSAEVDCFVFILFGLHWISWMCNLMLFTKF